MGTVLVEGFFDPATSTVSYIVHGGAGTDCAVIDPVLDFDLRSGRTGTKALEPLITRIEALQLRLALILETHIHADHVTGAQLLKDRFGGAHAAGRDVAAVARHFAPIFGIEAGGFDHLYEDGDRIDLNSVSGEVIAVPGHTPDSVAYKFGDAVFVGDTLFMPDGGTARCDFPGGDAAVLWRSIRKLLTFPDATRLFVCHDYQPEGRPLRFEATVAEQRQANIHVRDGVTEAAFVQLRRERDRGLALPALFVPSVQINLRAGRLLDFVRVPIDRL